MEWFQACPSFKTPLRRPTCGHIWPRGFPLDFVQSPQTFNRSLLPVCLGDLIVGSSSFSELDWRTSIRQLLDGC